MGRPSPDLRSRLTLGKSPVRESRTPGPVRGDRGNPVPYRDSDALTYVAPSVLKILAISPSFLL